MALDPAAGEYPSLSPYAYCANNPLRHVDPDGENLGQFLEGFITGEWEAVKSAAVGLKNLVTDPLGTISQLANAVAHPIETGTAAVNAATESWSSGDAGKGRVVGRVGGELTLAAIGARGFGVPKSSPPPTSLGEAAGVAASRAAGRAGEAAAGVLGQGKRVPSLTQTASYRVADGLTPTTLTEIKNVRQLSLTSQLRDFDAFAQATGRQFLLYTRSDTAFSKPLQALIRDGRIVWKPIPGM